MKSSVIGLVGTAPYWAVPSPAAIPGLNAPTLVSSAQDAAQFGPAVQGYTIPYALNAILGQGAGQAIVVNVFDNSKHTSDIVSSQTFSAAGAINLGHMGVTHVTVMPTTTAPVIGESHTFGGTLATIQLAHGNVQASSLVLTSNPVGTTYVQGTDYLVNARTGLITRVTGGGIGATAPVLASYSYYSGTPYTVLTDHVTDPVNGVLTLAVAGAIAAGATVIVSFSYADPSKVQDSDLIGAVSTTGYTGLQALLTTYGTMGFFAKLLIVPGYSQNGDVATAMVETAETLRGMALIDSPANTPAATAIANRGVAGNAFDTSSTRAILCYPQETYCDNGVVPTGVTLSGTSPVPLVANRTAIGPYSQWVAGAIA